MRLEQIAERLRESGQLPRFVAPAGAEPPPELKSPPLPVTRIVGRRRVQAERS
ncbi:MAG: hypothetical protein H0X71_10215 [Rubrobacter sp.]|nr:hypothetical protein [Rubrobacter sp.]